MLAERITKTLQPDRTRKVNCGCCFVRCLFSTRQKNALLNSREETQVPCILFWNVYCETIDDPHRDLLVRYTVVESRRTSSKSIRECNSCLEGTSMAIELNELTLARQLACHPEMCEVFLSIIEKRSSRNLHLAIFSEPFLSSILSGRKKIDSRFSRVKCAPYKKLKEKDFILIKE